MPTWRPARYSGMLQPLVELLIGLGIGLGVVVFGGFLLQRGSLEVGRAGSLRLLDSAFL